jgi:hypothetical protein
MTSHRFSVFLYFQIDTPIFGAFYTSTDFHTEIRCLHHTSFSIFSSLKKVFLIHIVHYALDNQNHIYQYQLYILSLCVNVICLNPCYRKMQHARHVRAASCLPTPNYLCQGRQGAAAGEHHYISHGGFAFVYIFQQPQPQNHKE